MGKRLKKTSAPAGSPCAHWLFTGGIWLAAAGVPLLWTDVVVAEYTLPKFMLLSAGLLLSSLGLIFSARSGTPLVRPTPLDFPLAACAGGILLTTVFSQDRTLSLLGQYNSITYGVWAMFLYAAAYYCASWLPNAHQRRRTLEVCIGAGGMVGLYGVIQSLGYEPTRLSEALPSGRAVSTIGSPVHLGAYLSLLIPPALHWTLEKRPSRWVGGLCLLLLGGGLLGSVSRGAWVSTAAGTGLYLFLSDRLHLPRLRKAGWAGLAATALMTGGLVLNRLGTRPVQLSDSARVEAWNGAWDIFHRKPLLGSGPDTFDQQFRANKSEAFLKTRGTFHHHAHAHCDILQAMATTGLAGTIPYVTLWFVLGWAAWRRLGDPERRGETAALSGGLLTVFIVMKFNPMSIDVLALAAVLAGLMCAHDATGEESTNGGNALTSGFVLAATLSTIAVLRLGAADLYVQRARIDLGRGRSDSALAHLRRGIALNACELKYKILFANEILNRVRAGAPGREEFLEEAALTGRRAVACHPNYVNAHYIYGLVSLVRAQLGRAESLPIAERELDTALTLDPTFLPLLNLRLETAQFAGDTARTQEVKTKISSLAALPR